tara:strand:+ start:57 stop:1193 length:1137 start_codon:yes stop_codon:yes gene_type:complete
MIQSFRFLIVFLFALMYSKGFSWAFDYEFDGRVRADTRYIFDSLEGFDDFDNALELRLGGHGDIMRQKSLVLDYEVLVDFRTVMGPSEQVGYAREIDLDVFRGWFRLDGSKWRLRVGRQQILFSTGTLFRPLGFFDSRIISSVFPLASGVDGLRLSWFKDDTTTVQAWAVPTKAEGLVIVGGRWEGLIGKIEAGLAIQYSPKTDLDTIPNFDLEVFQTGYQLKGEFGIGLWMEGRLDLEQHLDGDRARFESVWGTDYTFDFGNGLHVLLEYFLSVSEVGFSNKDLRGDRKIHQLGLQLDQPIGIATVWRLFGFYDLGDTSFQITPQIEYAATDNTFLYLQGNWGGDAGTEDDFGRFFRKTSTFSGTESSVGLTLIVFF